MKDSFNNLINSFVNVFAKLFNIELYWDYAIIDQNSISLLDKIYCAYVPEEKAIIINPFIYKIKELQKDSKLLVSTIISKIAHEARHAWQHQFQKYNFIDYKPYAIAKNDYLYQDAEIDAYAFEEMILKYLYDTVSIELNIRIKEVHSKSTLLLKQYSFALDKLLNKKIIIKKCCFFKKNNIYYM